MVVIATADVQLAQRLGEVVIGRKSYIVDAEDPKRLRHLIHSDQPEVVVLDVRLGGNRYRSMGEVPKIMQTRSQPGVIVLLPWRSRVVEKEAARIGCFDCLVIGRPSFLRRVAQSVAEARAAWAAGALEPPQHGPVSLH